VGGVFFKVVFDFSKRYLQIRYHVKRHIGVVGGGRFVPPAPLIDV
jgi:hypothetical protein